LPTIVAGRRSPDRSSWTSDADELCGMGKESLDESTSLGTKDSSPWYYQVCDIVRLGFFKCRLQARTANLDTFWLSVLRSHSLKCSFGDLPPSKTYHAPFWNASKSEVSLYADFQSLHKMSVVNLNDSLRRKSTKKEVQSTPHILNQVASSA
jgi:hypothetical protein